MRTATPVADGLDRFVGRWRVVGVTVAPSPVQALTPDDPTLLNAVLDVTRDRLWWDARPSGSFDDTCIAPRLTLDGQINCSGSEFGPPGARLLARGNRITLGWYDGGTLELVRAPGLYTAAPSR